MHLILWVRWQRLKTRTQTSMESQPSISSSRFRYSSTSREIRPERSCRCRFRLMISSTHSSEITMTSSLWRTRRTKLRMLSLQVLYQPLYLQEIQQHPCLHRAMKEWWTISHSKSLWIITWAPTWKTQSIPIASWLATRRTLSRTPASLSFTSSPWSTSTRATWSCIEIVPRASLTQEEL